MDKHITQTVSKKTKKYWCGYINTNKMDLESMSIKGDAIKDTFTI